MPLEHDSSFVPVEVFRVLRGLKQHQLSAHLDISEQGFRKKITGAVRWQPGELEGLAAVLHVPVSVLRLNTAEFTARLLAFLDEAEEGPRQEKIA